MAVRAETEISVSKYFQKYKKIHRDLDDYMEVRVGQNKTHDLHESPEGSQNRNGTRKK